MNKSDSTKWIPCDKELPNGEKDEIACLVTCQEWDIFQGKWGDKEVQILSYSTSYKQWNTKSDIRVLAWSILPKPDAILPAFSPGIPAGIRSIRSLMGKPSKSRRYPNGT